MNLNRLELLVAIVIVITVSCLSYLVFSRTLVTNFLIGPFRLSHWLSIIGAIYIALATPIFVLMKRKYPNQWNRLVTLHLLGNLLAFGLIAFHFSAQVGRPPANYPELGTGVAMFLAMSLQIATGFILRFSHSKGLLNPRTIKFVHASLVMVFYAVIIFHVLHGLGLT